MLTDVSGTNAFITTYPTSTVFGSANRDFAVARREGSGTVELTVTLDLSQMAGAPFDMWGKSWGVSVGWGWSGASTISRHQLIVTYLDMAGQPITSGMVEYVPYPNFVVVYTDSFPEFVENVGGMRFTHRTKNSINASRYDLGLDNISFQVEVPVTCPPLLPAQDLILAGGVQSFELCQDWPGGQLVLMGKDTDPDPDQVIPDDEIYHGIPVPSSVPGATLPALEGKNITDNNSAQISEDVNPVLSPDGYWLAFLSDRDSPGIYQLFVASYGGFNVKRLSSIIAPEEIDLNSPLSWFSDPTNPSNTKIAFTTNQGIKTIELDGTTTTVAGTGIGDRNPSLHPTTGALAYLNELGQIVISGTLISPFPTNHSDTNLAWSPNGGELAYVTSDGNIFAYNPSAATSRSIREIYGNEVVPNKGLAWSPDGKYIAYVKEDSNDLHFWDIVNLAENEIGIGKAFSFPSWSVLPSTSEMVDPTTDNVWLGTILCDPANTVQLEPIFPGVSQEALDMLAIAYEATNELIVYETPIINSQPSGTISFSTGTTVTVLERIIYLDPNAPDPTTAASIVWYHIQSGSGIDGWIVAQMTDFDSSRVRTLSDYAYVVGGDVCNTIAPPPTAMSFSYDRAAAVKYAIAHAYQNEVLLHLTPPPPEVTQRLDPTHPAWTSIDYPGGTGDFELFTSTIPYANFINSGYNPADPLATGSAMFTSQSIWMGRMPMTRDGDGNARNDAATNQESGWRYVPVGAEGDGNFTWRKHEVLLSYYTSFRPYYPGVVDIISLANQGTTEGINIPNAVNNPYFPPIANATISVEQLSLGRLPAVDLEQGEVIPALLNPIINAALINSTGSLPVGRVQAGDYVWIDSYRCPNGDSICSNKVSLPHGLLIAGWGEAVNCDVVLKSTADGGLRVTLGDGLELTYQTSMTNPVPYVVDFSYDLQQPIPRPFYCTNYNGDADDHWFNFNLTGWYFFTLPDPVYVDPDRLYMSPTWSW